MKIAFFLTFFGLAFGSLGYSVGKSEGYKTGVHAALKTNPPSAELEMACVGLWVGDQNRKYYEKKK